MSDLSLTTSRVIHAPREKVFNAWLDPAVDRFKALSQWTDDEQGQARQGANKTDVVH